MNMTLITVFLVWSVISLLVALVLGKLFNQAGRTPDAVVHRNQQGKISA
jgi:hypothetical protein